MTEVVLTVGPGHTLRQAAAAMCERRVGAAVVLDPEGQGPGVITERDVLRAVGGFRHLVVVDAGQLAGILSMRDIVRVWCGDGALCEVAQ